MYHAPADGPREHSDLNPDFSDGVHEAAEAADPEAPWGRKADGSPKAKPGRPAGTPDRNPRTRQRRRTMAAPPRKQAVKPKQAKAASPDYRPGIRGILQLIAAPLAVAGIKSPPLALDAAAVTAYADPIADAMQETAEQVPAFGAVLDRILTVGPYGALLAAAMPLAVQIAANHGMLPPQVATAMGALSPEDLIALVSDDPEQAA